MSLWSNFQFYRAHPGKHPGNKGVLSIHTFDVPVLIMLDASMQLLICVMVVRHIHQLV